MPRRFALSALVLAACTPSAPQDADPVDASPLFEDPVVVDTDNPPQMLELAIPVGDDIMNGIVLTANGAGPHPGVLLLHAYPGFEQNLDLAQALRRLGYSVFTFHYRGTWGSGGAFSWDRSLEDVGHALAHLRENANRFRIDPARVALVGHSFGGILSLRAGPGSDDFSCVVSLAPEDWTQWLGTEDDRQSIVDYLAGVHAVEGYSPEHALADLITDQDEWMLDTVMRGLGDAPVLLVNASEDSSFDTPTRERYTTLARESGATALTSVTIEEADHSFNARRIALIETVTEWMEGACR
jgi:dienelactone hydrolase